MFFRLYSEKLTEKLWEKGLWFNNLEEKTLVSFMNFVQITQSQAAG